MHNFRKIILYKKAPTKTQRKEIAKKFLNAQTDAMPRHD